MDMKNEIFLFISLVLRDKRPLFASKEVVRHGAERTDKSQ